MQHVKILHRLPFFFIHFSLLQQQAGCIVGSLQMREYYYYLPYFCNQVCYCKEYSTHRCISYLTSASKLLHCRLGVASDSDYHASFPPFGSLFSDIPQVVCKRKINCQHLHSLNSKLLILWDWADNPYPRISRMMIMPCNISTGRSISVYHNVVQSQLIIFQSIEYKCISNRKNLYGYSWSYNSIDPLDNERLMVWPHSVSINLLAGFPVNLQ